MCNFKTSWSIHGDGILLPFYHRAFRAILDFAHGVEGEFPGDGVEERDNLDEEIVSTEGNYAMVILDGLG